MHTYCTKSVIFSYLLLGDDERESLEAFSPIYILNLNDFYSHYHPKETCLYTKIVTTYQYIFS